MEEADTVELLEIIHTNDKLQKIEKRRKDKSDTATVDKVLDPKTVKILENLVKRKKLAELSGAVSSGKEANVYTAKCSGSLISKFIQPEETVPSGLTDEPMHPVVLKIYKTSTMLFKDRTRYIVDEKRFKNFCTSNHRKMIKLWSEKEVRNLKRLAKNGIPCPKPLYLKGSVLIMTMIGDTKPGSRLKDVVLTDIEWEGVYKECILLLTGMYQKAKLVHADFSEYNLIYHSGRVHVIDVGQSMDVYQENSTTFLMMDLINCNGFFSKKGVQTRDETDLFEEITGLKIPEYLKIDGKLSKDSFIPTRVTDVVNEEDFSLFTEGLSERTVVKKRMGVAEEKKTEEKDTSGIELYVRRLCLKNPDISKEEEKSINKERKSIIKEMNRERRMKRAERKKEYKVKKK